MAIARTPRSGAQTAAIGALAAHRTDEGVKTLKSLLDDPHENVWTPLADALLNGYRNGAWQPGDFTAQDVKPLLERMLASGSRSPDVLTGISLLEHFGSDAFTAQLIGIATDSSSFARQSAVYALALNRTEEGLKTLKSLLNSSDPKIREVTENAIRAAYTSRGDSLGRPLQPADFDKQYQQPKAGK
jgi:HEAT repeat protein